MLKQFMKISLFLFTVLYVSIHVWAQDENPYINDTSKAIEFMESNDFDSAKPIIEKLLAASETPEGNNENMAMCLGTLGNECRLNSKYEIAEKLLKNAIEIHISVQAREDPTLILININNLATLYQDQGKYYEAEPLLKVCLQVSEKALGKEHPDTLMSMNNLAFLYAKQGKYSEAEPLLKECLQVSENILGKEHPDTLNSMGNLAALYDDQGKYSEAEPLYKECLKLKETILGKEHPDTLTSMNNLGSLYQNQGKYSEAEPLYKKCLQLREKSLGKEHPDTLNSMNNLGMLYQNQGKYSEAEPFLKKCPQICENILGKEHPDTLMSMNNLGVLYQAQGKYPEAEPLLKECLQVNENILGKEHPQTLMSMNDLCVLYDYQGKYSEAEPLYKECLQLCEKTLGKEHPDTLMPMNNLGALYQAQGKYSEAEPLLKECLQVNENILGKEHPQTLGAINNLASLFCEQNKYSETESLCNVLITLLEKGIDLPADKSSLYYANRSLLYTKTDRPEKAFEDLKKAIRYSREARKHASTSEETRAEMFGRQYYLYVDMVGLQHKYLHDMTEVYLAMEMSRAQGLQDLMDAGNQNLFANMDPDMAQKLQKEDSDANALLNEKSKETEVKQNALVKFRKENKIEGEEIPANLQEEYTRLYDDLHAKMKEVAQARQRVVESLNAIRSASPIFRDILGKDRMPVPFDKVNGALNVHKTIAFEYILGGDASFLFVYGSGWKEPKVFPLVITKEQAEILEVKPGNLTKDLCDEIFLNENGQFKHSQEKILNLEVMTKLYTLWNVLVPDPEITKIAFKQKRILLLPDGALTKVPFEMLVVQKPESANPKYLLDMPAATIYSPAASIWYNLTLRKKNQTDSILTMGDANYNKENVQNATRGVQSQLEYINRSDFTPLPNTRVESDTLKERSGIQNFTCTQFLSDEATEEYLRNNVGGKSIVHIACHGLADNSYGGAFAALVLSPGSSPDDPQNDGFLTLSEMFGLDLNSCTLAVLSACETNLGANQKGEGTWSICRGFQTSGATNVVTTNWNVNDLAGAILVAQFVNDVMTAPNDDQMAEKLQKARRLLRSGILNKKWAHPYFWAPFILMGP